MRDFVRERLVFLVLARPLLLLPEARDRALLALDLQFQLPPLNFVFAQPASRGFERLASRCEMIGKLFLFERQRCLIVPELFDFLIPVLKDE